MRILTVDDEKRALDVLVNSVKQAEPNAEILSFTSPKDAIELCKDKAIDVAFLDISMEELSGVILAEELKKNHKGINIVFSTTYDEYRDVAFDIHASGYIIKPITPEKVRKELDDLRYPVQQNNDQVVVYKKLLKVNCYGNFDVFNKMGQALYFERQKSKELFAYLVFRHGASCTVKEIAGVLFEDLEYDKRTQAYLQKIISTMMSTLRSIEAESVINKKYNSLGVVAELIDCDYYRALENNDKSGYMGEFMSQYSWAEEANWFFIKN